MRSLRIALTGAAIQVLSVVVLAGAQVQAQGVDLVGDRGPRFLLAPSTAEGRTIPLDVRETAVLRRPVRLDFDNATIKSALAALTEQSGVDLVYSDDVLPADVRVTLHAQGIAVAAALTHILLDARVDVVFLRNGTATLRRQPAPLQVGSVSGRVTDASTQQGIEGVRVSLEGTRSSTTTGSTGSYRLTGVAAGAYALVVRRLGYRELERAVTVEDGREVTVDVTLQPVPSALDKVVVTVTGEQRLRELGHVVGRIQADSLVRAAPITTITELLTARVPGLQVFQGQGTVGGDVRVQIRGVNSLALNTEPIVVVDGIRYSTTRTAGGIFLNAAESSSRLNDLNPNDIESIEVVKGPSAATLYGTDASNGVLVIRTKRGRPGPARLATYARFTRMGVSSQRFPDNYWAWGTRTNQCTLSRVASGSCTQDSITKMPTPLKDRLTSVLGTQGNVEYGANVSGGRDDLRYYFSGDLTDETSPLQLPSSMIEEMRQRLGSAELPAAWLDPNHVRKANVRANLHALLGARGELQVTSGYTQSATRMPVLGAGYRDAFSTNDPLRPYDGSLFDQNSTEDVNRFNVGGTGLLRPLEWLVLRANAGFDVTSAYRYSFRQRVQTVTAGRVRVRSGLVENNWTRGVTSTLDIGATATARPGRLTLRSSAGAQYVRSHTDGSFSTGIDLPPGGRSVQEATSQFTGQTFNETVTLGAYLEEMLGLNERLYLTGGLRADGASAFGQDYDAAIYPKAGVSWLASEEPFLPRVPGLDELRLRYAYGASGQQPTSAMGRAQLGSFMTFENGRPGLGLSTFSLPNPDLRPERVREHEFGFDAALLSNRVQLEATWYRRSVIDALRVIDHPAGLSQQWVNLGLLRDRGFELQAALNVIDSRYLSWDLSVLHATDDARLIRIGAGVPRFSVGGGFVEGHPIGARFMTPLLGFDDANGNGIIEPTELQLGTEPVYAGRSTPPHAQTLTNSLALFDRRVRLSTLFERRSGFTQTDFNLTGNCTNANCLARLDLNTPLAEQARVMAFGRSAVGFGDAPYSPIEKGDFIRLREASVSVDVPGGLLRALRLGNGTVTIAGRNLALWTSFSGADPESTGGIEGPNHAFASQGGVFGGRAGGVPQSRVWTARFDLGF